MLEPVLFALFSVSAVVFAFNVVFRRNAVHCALHLVGVLLSLSGMFVLLNAQFIAAIQILIYAGAIMVLFLFVVMLLNVKGEAPLLTPGAWKGFGFFFALIVFVELLYIVLSQGGTEGTPAAAVPLPPGFGSPAEIGRILYSTWLFPFEVTSILLLIAVIGAVVLAKRKFA
ncbi:MAG: NADH-quinone oxidoreductase subunit J [Candidatus Eisenbacteria bacterium]|uniref:NADH-quinone oxidoreductase subunit J n=1 Tax=Eiseniibacteriota bacterium TaxID=2212470 RepID=A0A538SEI2_UNCEI|nr:MAG: NADH-quinone oxidoreductase subunit J [Candidatus Eisenbacteria bacterium]